MDLRQLHIEREPFWFAVIRRHSPLCRSLAQQEADP